ncbi:hypothetical protein SRHO_G00302960 [Serrasalmus rhombeus]
MEAVWRADEDMGTEITVLLRGGDNGLPGLCTIALGRWMMSLKRLPQRRADRALRLRLGSPIISLTAIKCSSFILPSFILPTSLRRV